MLCFSDKHLTEWPDIWLAAESTVIKNFWWAPLHRKFSPWGTCVLIIKDIPKKKTSCLSAGLKAYKSLFRSGTEYLQLVLPPKGHDLVSHEKMSYIGLALGSQSRHCFFFYYLGVFSSLSHLQDKCPYYKKNNAKYFISCSVSHWSV